MIRNHPEFVAVLAILVTLPCAYMLGSAARRARTEILNPIHREIRQEVQQERDRVRREIQHNRDNFRQDLLREREQIRMERDRLRRDLREGIRSVVRARSV